MKLDVKAVLYSKTESGGLWVKGGAEWERVTFLLLLRIIGSEGTLDMT